MLNIDLLRDAVEWVEWQGTLDVEKREWEQSVWWVDLDAARKDENSCDGSLAVYKSECGTAYCFAGYVAQKVHGADFFKKLYKNNQPSTSYALQLSAEALGILDDDKALDIYHDLTNEDNDPKAIRNHANKIANLYGMEL